MRVEIEKGLDGSLGGLKIDGHRVDVDGDAGILLRGDNDSVARVTVTLIASDVAITTVGSVCEGGSR